MDPRPTLGAPPAVCSNGRPNPTRLLLHGGIARRGVARRRACRGTGARHRQPSRQDTAVPRLGGGGRCARPRPPRAHGKPRRCGPARTEAAARTRWRRPRRRPRAGPAPATGRHCPAPRRGRPGESTWQRRLGPRRPPGRSLLPRPRERGAGIRRTRQQYRAFGSRGLTSVPPRAVSQRPVQRRAFPGRLPRR